jgi:uncharacterized repeat protein (TIGR01451 family)
VGADSAWEWALRLERQGPADDPAKSTTTGIVAYGNRIELLRGRVIEWFANTPKGIEHGLDISSTGDPGRVQFDFSVAGTLIPKVRDDGRAVDFVDARGTTVLRYPEIAAQDADERDVDVRWERLEGHEEPIARLRLVLDAAGRRSPIVVQGLITAGKGKGSSGRTRPAGALDTAAEVEAGSGPELLVAPANNLCPNAAVIPANGPFPYVSAIYDITDATTAGDPPTPSCQPNVSRSIWFAFNPAQTGNYTLSLCEVAPTLTTVPDTVLAVYSSTGACAGLAQVAGGCDDDSCLAGSLQSVISDLLLTSGTTYYVVAWQYGTTPPDPGFSDIQLRVVRETMPPTAPPNDQCGGAEVIPGAGPFPYLTAVTADISDATITADPPVPLCQPNVTRSIWYSFTPVVSGNYTFSACADAPSGTTVDDTVMAIYASTGACGGLVSLAGGCDDDSCGVEELQSALSGLPLTGGVTYYIVVWKYDVEPPAAGNTAVQIRVSQVLGPGNDTCGAAVPLVLDSPVGGSTTGGSDDYQLAAGSACFSGLGQTASTAPGLDTVYRFTAPRNDSYSFRVTYDATKNAVLYVASDCPAGPAPATVTGCLGAANRHTSNPAEEVKCLALLSGQTVYAYIDEHALTAGGAFSVEVNACREEIEPNDTPATAGGFICGMEGSISSAAQTDIDFHGLGSPPAGSRVFALVDGAAANSTDFDLRVTTGADTLEYDDLNNDIPFGGSAPNVAGTPLTGVASYLRVSQKAALTAGEPYRVYSTVQAPSSSASPEVEPNDTIAQATTAVNLYFSGAMSATTDIDIYSFTAAAGDLILLGLDLDPQRDNTPFNGSLALLDSAGATILAVNDGGSLSNTTPGTGNLASTTPSSPAEAIAYRARASATYYARVTLSTGTPRDYLLSISRNCRAGPPADLAVTQTDAPDPVPPGGSVTYSVSIVNSGTQPSTLVTLRDDLPAGAVYVSAIPSQGSCAGTGPVVCHLGTISGGGGATVQVTIQAPAIPGAIHNDVVVSSTVTDPNPANDVNVESTNVGGADSDGDGVPDASDCAPNNNTAWAIPGEATALLFPGTPDLNAMQWNPPVIPGGTVVYYDVLRSNTKNGFSTATCVGTGLTATTISDPTPPSAGLYYLVRARNVCGGRLGTQSDGTPIIGPACP